jgi:hypothetical protein
MKKVVRCEDCIYCTDFSNAICSKCVGKNKFVRITKVATKKAVCSVCKDPIKDCNNCELNNKSMEESTKKVIANSNTHYEHKIRVYIDDAVTAVEAAKYELEHNGYNICLSEGVSSVEDVVCLAMLISTHILPPKSDIIDANKYFNSMGHAACAGCKCSYLCDAIKAK